MDRTSVLRLHRSDDESAFVLIQVTATGSRPLDVKLLGTEGSEPYAVSLRQDRVGSLRAQGSSCTETEWRSILQSILQLEPLQNITVEVTVQTQSSLTITVRRSHQGITQRLGALVLNYSPNEEIELCDWCAQSVEASIKAKKEGAASYAKIQELERAVQELKSQLTELVEAKQENETELLEKFCLLLNEKKVKIREQQMLLASTKLATVLTVPDIPVAKQDDEKAEPDPAPTRGAKSKASTRRIPGPSRPAKRKTRATAKAKEDEEFDNEPEPEPEDPPIENMDVDKEGKSDISDDRETTDDDETASEEDADTAPVAGGAGIPVKPAALQPPRNKPLEPPPLPRNLPFTTGKKSEPAKAAPAKTVQMNESETESDSEL